jgi:amidase
MDGVAQTKGLRDGSLTSSGLVEAAIAKAEKVNPKINAIVTKTFETARAQAKASEGWQSEAMARKPIAGLPTFMKDLHDWKGAPTLYGSRAFKGNAPAKQDDVFLDLWRKGGMICLGKSTTPEYGLTSCTEPLLTGPTRNPWNTSRISGGSSGGAAALVAARVVPFAHASDGGGSIRIPAACCGLFGLKPSRGAFPSPDEDLPVDVSVQHAVTLTVRDSAALFAMARAGIDTSSNGPIKSIEELLKKVSSDSKMTHVTGPSTRRLKIAYAPKPTTDVFVDAATITALDDTAQLCRDLGHEVIDFSYPYDGDKFVDQFLMLWSAGAAQFAQRASEFSGKPISPEIVEPWTLGLAQKFLARQDEMDDVLKYLIGFEAVYHSWFDKFDVILSPTVSTTAPAIGAQAPDGDFETVWNNVLGFAAFTPPMNVAGAASMSVPLHQSEGGMPVASMFSAQKGDDGLLLALAYELEAARPWIGRKPAISL